MSIHVFTAKTQPATNYVDRSGERSMRFKNPAARLLPTCCCKKRLPARDLTVQCYYDQTLFSCKPGKGCKAPKKPKQRARLAPMSAKTKAKQPARRKCCAEVRERCGGRCEAALPSICTGKMQDTHEILARSAGGDPTDPNNALGLCRPCHHWITTHMNEAREMGLAK